MISVIAAAGFWMAFNTQAQEAAPEAQNTPPPPPCPMGFERPANCPMVDSQTTGSNMWSMRGGPRGPMMGGIGQGMAQGACPTMAPEQGMAQGACPMVAPGSNFTPGPKKARRGDNAMMSAPGKKMSKWTKGANHKRGQRKGWDAKATAQGWGPKGPRYGNAPQVPDYPCPMMEGQGQGMSQGPQGPAFNQGSRQGRGPEAAPQGWAPRGPRYGYGNAFTCPNMCPNVCPNCGCPMMAPGQGMSQGPQGPAFNRGPRQGRGAGAAQGWAPRGQRYGWDNNKF